jgi:hypothetical protein
MVQPYDKRWDAVTLDGHVVTDVLDAPLHWRKPRAVRLHGDLFHDDVPDDFIAQVFAVMALSPHHTFQVLTKRPERMREFMRHVDLSDIGDHFYPLGDRMRWDMDLYIDEWGPLDRWPLPNVWMGTSAEDQPTFDLRVPFLRETPFVDVQVHVPPHPVTERIEVVADVGQVDVAHKLPHPLRPLSQDLKRVVWGECHDCEHLGDEVIRNVVVEQVAMKAHRARLAPVERRVQHVGHDMPV